MPHMPSIVASGRSSSTQNGYGGRVFTFTDDWFVSNTIYNVYAATSNMPVIGSAPYSITFNTSGSIGGMTGSGRMGVALLITGADTTGRARLHTLASGAFDAGGQANMDLISFEAVLAFDAVSSAAQEYRAEIGLVGMPWLASPRPGFGCFFRYNRAVSGAHKWEAVTRELDVETRVVLDGTTQNGIETVDAGTIDGLSLPTYGFFRLKVVAYSDGEGNCGRAEFYVNGTLCATIDTNLPTHSLAGSVDMEKQAGTTSRYMALDFTELVYVLNTERVP